MSPQGESEAVSHDEPAEFLLRGMPEDKPFDLEERHFALMEISATRRATIQIERKSPPMRILQKVIRARES